MAAVLEKLRLPMGSMIVDSMLVLTLAFTAGSITNRLESIADRVLEIEQREATSRLVERTAILEQRAVLYDRDRSEVLATLQRIEQKIDQKADKPR